MNYIGRIFNNKWTWLVIAIIGFLAFTAELYLQKKFIREHPLSFTVIDQAGPIIERRQFKGGSELITQQWIRIQYDSTKAIHDFPVENPFAAKSFAMNGNYTWSKPLITVYDKAGYEYPWYISAGCAVLTIIGTLLSALVFFLASVIFRD